MKPFRAPLCAFAFFAVFAAYAAVGDPASRFREEISARLKELGKGGKTTAAAIPGIDEWLFLVAELRFLSFEQFWGDAAAKTAGGARKADAADPLPAIVDFQKQL